MNTLNLNTALKTSTISYNSVTIFGILSYSLLVWQGAVPVDDLQKMYTNTIMNYPFSTRTNISKNISNINLLTLLTLKLRTE